MKSRQKALLAIVVAASVTVLAGCSAGGSHAPDASFSTKASGSMSAWGFDNADDVGTSRLDYAKSQLPGVTIKIDQTAFDAQKFTTRVASGDVPDAVQMDRQFVGTYAAQGLIQPLDTCFSANGVKPDSQYYPSVMDDVSWNGHVWAVPQFYQPPAIILDKRVMDAAGVTADEIDTSKPDVLLAAVKKMYRESGGNPSTLGFDAMGVNQAGLWLLGFGGKLMDDKGVPKLDDPNNAKAITFLKKLTDAQGGYAKGKSFIDSFDSFGEKNPFVLDQVGAQINPQWYVNVLTPYASGVDISAVPYKDAAGKNFTVASGTSFVIPAGAKNADAACAWMLKLTSHDAWMAAGAARAKTIAGKPGAINTGLFTGSPAADKAIREKYVVKSGNTGFDETIATYYDVVGQGKSFGASPAGQEIQTELKNAVTSVLLGNKTPEKALSDAQTAAMRAYNKAIGK